MAVALPMLAGSGRLADPRYLEPIRFGLLLSASIAIGWLPASLHASRVAARLRLDRPRWRLLATVATVLLALGVAAWPTPAPLDPAVQSTIARFELLSSAAEIAAPPLRRIVAADPAIAGWPASARLSDRDRLDVFAVPGNIRPRLALDLGVPLTRIVATDPASLDLMAGRPPAGEIVVHCDADLPVPVFRPLEVSEPSNLGPVVLIPVLADAARGVWIVRLDAAGGGSPLSTPARR